MTTQPNPEFEYYRRQLLQRRRYYPIYGLLLFIVGGLGSLALVPLYIYNPRALFAFNQSPRLLHFVLILGFLAAIICGFSLMQRAFQHPSIQSIQRFRQRQRQRLFLEAHGRVPWWSSLPVRIVLASAGVLFAVGGVTVMSIFGIIALDAWIYLLIAAFLFALPFYFIPREMKKFPALRAEQLAQDWMTGEASGGDEASTS